MSPRKRRGRPVWQLLLIVVLGLGYWIYQLVEVPGEPRATASSAQERAPSTEQRSATAVSQRLLEAIAAQESEVWVESAARVTRLLRDDTRGSRHQRFLVDVGGNSVLVAHNIDLAPRVPAQAGDEVVLRGRFEWNDKGGVLHWTHHDPQNRLPGGWIEHAERVYR